MIENFAKRLVFVNLSGTSSWIKRINHNFDNVFSIDFFVCKYNTI